MFGLGYCIQTGIKLIFQMKTVLQRPKEMKNIFFKKSNLDLALFLGGFAGIYKVIFTIIIIKHLYMIFFSKNTINKKIFSWYLVL